MMKELAEILIEGVRYSFGPETEYMKEGSSFTDTNSAMVLEDLIGQFLYGDKKSSNSETEKTEASKAE